MKESEARRAEREARADTTAHVKSTTRHEGALARYLSAFGRGREEKRDKPAEPEQDKPAPAR